MQRFDAIVIGLGAHGSAAALALARRGLNVVGLEAGERGHGLGSSGGRSRMIRRAYFEDPAYLPLLAAAWNAWDALGAAAGEPLVEVTGGLYAGPTESVVFRGSVASAREQGLAHDVLDAAEIRRRWPIFAPADDIGGLFDPGAGMIRPERAIDAQLRLAAQAGAVLRFGERATDWRPASGGSAWRSKPTQASTARIISSSPPVPGPATSCPTFACRSRSNGCPCSGSSPRSRRRTSPSAGCRCGSWTRAPRASSTAFPTTQPPD